MFAEICPGTVEKQEKFLGIRKVGQQRICRSFITVSVREHFLCVRFKRDLIVAYHVLVQSVFFFLFEIMILLLCKMSGLNSIDNCLFLHLLRTHGKFAVRQGQLQPEESLQESLQTIEQSFLNI